MDNADAEKCRIISKRVEEIMSTPAVVVSRDTRVGDVVREMYKANVGSVIIVDNGGVVGIFTRKDLVYLAATGILAKNPRVDSVMSTSIVVSSPKDTIGDISRRMLETGVRHIPVVDQGKVVGVVSLSDLARYAIEELIRACPLHGNL